MLRAGPSDRSCTPRFGDPKAKRPLGPFSIDFATHDSWWPRFGGPDQRPDHSGTRAACVLPVSVVLPLLSCPPCSPNLGQGGGSVASHPESTWGVSSGSGVTTVSSRRRAGGRGSALQLRMAGSVQAATGGAARGPPRGATGPRESAEVRGAVPGDPREEPQGPGRARRSGGRYPGLPGRRERLCSCCFSPF